MLFYRIKVKSRVCNSKFIDIKDFLWNWVDIQIMMHLIYFTSLNFCFLHSVYFLL